MKKLIEGIVKFRTDVLPQYRETFAQLALGQSPDALFIGCSDSRVAVNVFASTDPGDLFVIRNVGNLIPVCMPQAEQVIADPSVPAAIEFAIQTLKVSHVIVCGHSECGAMQALISGRQQLKSQHLKEWLRHGDDALEQLQFESTSENINKLSRHNRLSQINVLKQIEHLKTYPLIQNKLQSGELLLHAWWFELGQADVYAFEESVGEFVLIDEKEAVLILERMKKAP
jgi:carbonic anhydrase